MVEGLEVPVVFYMECFQFFRFWEEEPDKYQFRLEERLANSFYNESTNGAPEWPRCAP